MKARDYSFLALCTLVGVGSILERIYETEWFDASNGVAASWEKYDWYWPCWVFSYPGAYGVVCLYFAYAILFSHDKVMLMWDAFFW